MITKESSLFQSLLFQGSIAILKLPAHIKHQITSNVEFLVKLKPDLVVITSFSNPK